MTRDSKGNNLDDTEVVLGGKIAFVPYSEDAKISAKDIAPSVEDPKLPDAYTTDSIIGLITSDGGFQDGRDGDDNTEFFQPGYTIPGQSSLTTSFTTAENNELIRRMTLGKPDEDGVYHVTDIIQPDKWCCYQEEYLRGGKTRRRAGVVQITGNEPNQSERGSVKGQQLTATWLEDDLYDGDKYIEAIYDPNNTTTTTPAVTQ